MGVRQALRLRYAPPAYALFEEVGNATGTFHNRRADAVAMSLWPSRGLELIGIEIKADRGDWKRELANPAKAEAIAKYCDRWYLAVEDEKIASVEELPATWGLLAMRGDKLVQKKEAAKLDCEPVSRKFLAALLRRAHEQLEHMVPKSDLEERLRVRLEEERAKIVEQFQSRDHLHRRIKELEETIGKFEAASGVQISGSASMWMAGRIGEAVKVVMDGHGGLSFYRQQLEQAANSAEYAAKAARDEISKLDKLAAVSE